MKHCGMLLRMPWEESGEGLKKGCGRGKRAALRTEKLVLLGWVCAGAARLPLSAFGQAWRRVGSS